MSVAKSLLSKLMFSDPVVPVGVLPAVPKKRQRLPNKKIISHRGHEGVEDTDREGRPAGERLREVELGVGVVVVVLVQELHVGVVDELGDHGDVGAVYGALALEYDLMADGEGQN